MCRIRPGKVILTRFQGAKLGKMEITKRLVLLCLAALCTLHSQTTKAQRISDYNTFGWFASFNTIHINKQWSVWLEYQSRRDNLITDWQQLFARTGLQYHLSKDMSAMVGYAFAYTYDYGDYSPGRHPIPEHRIFEQFQWNDDRYRVDLTHRFRLEQRYIGKVIQSAEFYQQDGWNYVNRLRYQLRATMPLNHSKMKNKTWYAAAYDEIFIGFGKNVKQNVFDQNRVGLLLGYQLNKTFRAEAGYFNVIQQQGSLVDNKEVFQYNSGLIVNLYLTLNKK